MRLLSIVIPVYNVEEYLTACLESITSQVADLAKVGKVEVICIDDGSTDCSIDVLRTYERNSSCVRVVSQKNGGVSTARNHGLDLSSGKWIMFVDPDDIVAGGTVDLIQRFGELEGDIVYFDYRAFEDGTDPMSAGVSPVRAPEDVTEFRTELQSACLAGRPALVRGLAINSCSPWAKLYSRSFLLRENLRFQDGLVHNEDVLFNMECLDVAGRIVSIDWVGIHYRLRSSSVSHRYRPDVLECSDRLLNSFEELFPRLRNQDVDWNALFSRRVLRDLVRCVGLGPFHPDNPHSFEVRKSEFGEIESRDRFRSALKHFRFPAHPLHESFVLACVRFGFASLLNVALRSRRSGRRSPASVVSSAVESFPRVSRMFRGRTLHTGS